MLISRSGPHFPTNSRPHRGALPTSQGLGILGSHERVLRGEEGKRERASKVTVLPSFFVCDFGGLWRLPFVSSFSFSLFFFFDCSLRLPWTTSKTIAASLFISFISHTTSFSVSCPFHHFAHYDHTVHQSCMLAQVVQIRVVRVALSISCSLPLLLSYP